MKKLSAPSGMAFAVILSVPLWAMIMLVTYVCLFATGCTITIPDINLPDDPVSPLPPIVVTTTTTTTTIPPSADVLPAIKWLGKDYSKATVDPQAVIRSASLDNAFIYSDYSMPSSWKRETVKGADCQAIFCFFYERNGLTGGKLDWSRTGGQSKKTIENAHSGYGGHTMPIKGTPCYLMLVSTDGKQRTNFIKMNWK